MGALACLGLSQVPDPRSLGIRSEPSRILFYGASGLVGGVLGVVALVCTLLWVARRADTPR